MMTVSTNVAPRVSSPARPDPGTAEKEKKKEKKEKTGLLSAAKAKATGSLRKALYGKSKKKESVSASGSAGVDEEDDDDYSSSNYDTVRSLPASGHYGNRRPKPDLHVDTSAAATPSSSATGSHQNHYLTVTTTTMRPRSAASSSRPLSPLPPLTSAVVIRLPRRRGTQPSPTSGGARLSPGSAGARFRVFPAAPTDPDPSFDFAAWHSTVDLMNNQDAVYSLFMKAHKCYDLIPVSSKLVVFDTTLPVRKAFFALVYNGVRAAPLWDSARQTFVGMLTITDFIKILTKHHSSGESEEQLHTLEEQEIAAWRERFRQEDTLQPFVAVDPNESLYRAVQLLCESKVHRLPVLERSTGNISYILTHKRIMKFLSLYIHDLPKPAFMDETPKSLGIGVWGSVRCIHVNTPLIEALKIFLANRVSALPLVDENDKVVDIYAKFDVISLAADKAYSNLDISVHEALKHRQEWFEGVRTCKDTDPLYTVVENIVKAEVHRLIVTSEDDKVVGIISLSDILKHLVLDRGMNSAVGSAANSAAGDLSTVNSVSGVSPATTSASMMDLDQPVFDILPEEEHHELIDELEDDTSMMRMKQTV